MVVGGRGQGVRLLALSPKIISNTMGTSTARRGPSTGAWRIAKGTATRYLAPEGSAPVEAHEVVRCYVAALEESSAQQGQDLLGEFRLTRKAAQNLGGFGASLSGSGLTAALEASGCKDLAHLRPAELIPGLAQAWVEGQGTLEATVVRVALATCLSKILKADPTTYSPAAGPSLVGSFLAIAFCQRLAFDLGESLEAAAAGWPEYQDALARLQGELIAAAAEVTDDPPGAGQWRGLAGWLWVTRVLENILQQFLDAGP
jgi:hypothetical protein